MKSTDERRGAADPRGSRGSRGSRTRALSGAAGVGMLALTACGEAPDEAEAAGEELDYQACLVSDTSGWDDQSFNQSARSGLNAAIEDFGVDSSLAESQSDAEYAPNVDSMVQQGCDLVFGVGFLLQEAVQDAAEENPDTDFALIDEVFTDGDDVVEMENGKPLQFNTAEAAYLAGFVAAAMSETGTVGTFGGIHVPPVAVFMDGFADGVDRYNEETGEDVDVVGWDKEAQQGSFTGDFENQAQGRALTEQLLSQGADVIMPVAGLVGLGAAAAIEEDGEAMMIWVDEDGYETTDYGDIILTSVLKDISTAVYDTIEESADGGFSHEPYVGTLENGGVGLAPFHDFEDDVPVEVVEQLEEIQQEIIDGETVVETENAP